MSRELHGIEKGLRIYNENSQLVYTDLIQGSGAPTSGEEIGSTYRDYTNGAIYIKVTAGTGADKWLRLATTNDLSAISFRSEKVTVGTGEALSAGVRDLTATPFTDDDTPFLTAADFTVGDYIISGIGGTPKLFEVTVVATPNITLVEETTNPLAANDNFVVKYYLPDAPDDQEKEALVHYNGSAIIKLADMNWDIADGINLASGYAAVNGTISNADSVNSAIEKLDGNQIDLTTLSGVAQGAVDLGTFTGTIIADSSTIKAALQALEVDLDALQTLTGVAAEAIDLGSFTGSTIVDSSTIKVALQALETAVEGGTQKTLDTVTTEVSLDELLVDSYLAASYQVTVSLASDESNRETFKFDIHHDGTTSADAVNIDDTKYSKLKHGSVPFSVSADLNGATTAQVMRVRISAAAAVNVRAVRLSAVGA